MRGIALIVRAGAVVCASAFGSPTLLMRSGIGPGLQVDLPEVGRNYVNQAVGFMSIEYDQPLHGQFGYAIGTVVQIEDLWKQNRGVSDNRRYFNEILVNSENLVHLFMRSKSNADIVAVVICTRGVNVGMLFAQARRVMAELDAR